MNPNPDGGPAFPFSRIFMETHSAQDVQGMSLRDYFTGQAIMGLIANPQYMTEAARATDSMPSQLTAMLATFSVKIADALIEELNK